MWKQDVTPNLDPYVYDGGKLLTDWYDECLATVETAFGTPRIYPTAWAAWQANDTQNKDRNWPVGVYFPIWFSGYGGQGHVAFAYVHPDGSMNIWTSPYTHVPNFYTGYTSVDALAKGYGVTYVGWSEDIAGLRVIEYVADAPTPAPAAKYTVTETYSPAKQVKLNKQPTYLWGMNYDFDYMAKHPVETHNQGEVWAVTNKVHHVDGSDYYRRDGQIDGFNVVDCDDYTPPAPSQPTPVVVPNPPVTTPPADPVVTTPVKPPTTITVGVPAPITISVPPKVVVVEPTYFKIWELIVAIFKKLIGKK